MKITTAAVFRGLILREGYTSKSGKVYEPKYILDLLTDDGKIYNVDADVQTIKNLQLDNTENQKKAYLLKFIFHINLTVGNFEGRQWLRMVLEDMQQPKVATNQANI
jgi:hypothetical protein